MKTIPAHFQLYFPIESVCCTACGGILNKLKITGSIGGSIFRRCRQKGILSKIVRKTKLFSNEGNTVVAIDLTILMDTFQSDKYTIFEGDNKKC